MNENNKEFDGETINLEEKIIKDAKENNSSPAYDSSYISLIRWVSCLDQRLCDLEKKIHKIGENKKIT